MRAVALLLNAKIKYYFYNSQPKFGIFLRQSSEFNFFIIFANEINKKMDVKINYLPRISDGLLERKMNASGAVLIEGAKWCGKTSTALNVSKSVLYMQDTDRSKEYLNLADTKPSMLLQGETPRLLDEWQMAPVLWDAVRFAVDNRQKMGQFILTGSAVPVDGATMHSGTGRISRILMRPMSLFESQESNGTVSLSRLFAGKLDIESISSLTMDQIAFVICRGGWPASVGNSEQVALQIARDYIEAVINYDVQRVDGSEKNPARLRLLLMSLARNISTLATNCTIMADIEAHDSSMTDKTLNSYLNALRRIFLVEDVPAWQPSLRSKTAIRTSEKRQFVDPSIAAAMLHASPKGLWNNFELFGFLFESLCTRDMRIYAQANEGEVFHYRDKSGLEADMIIRLYNGQWAAVEVKMGNKQTEEAAANLIKLKAKVDTSKIGEPAFLMVLTGGEFAYKRKDGVLIVPIGCLKD